MKRNKIILAVLILSMITLIFSGCGGNGGNPTVPPIDNDDGDEEELKFWDGSFAGEKWIITTGYNGPQADSNKVYCSESLDNVWVDDQNPRRLHLKITYDNANERWNCAQIGSEETFGGYGKYTFYIDNIIMEMANGEEYNATDLDKNVVIGLYTYDNSCSHPSKNEIDLEFSQWGTSYFKEGWFIVWKDGIQTLRDRCNFPIQLAGKSSVHSFDWTENNIDFESTSGIYKKTAHYPSDDFENLGGDGYIPQPQNEKVLMNIWLDGGQPYSDDMKSAEIIISNFEYSSNDQTVEENGTYDLRDIGPAGGYIFYDKGSYSNGWRYLEAAPVSTEWKYKEWGGWGTLIGGTETGIGTGQSNTTIIVTWLNSHFETGRAAQLCDALIYGGYSDWFLPSKDELNLMYENLIIFGVGGFAASGDYWSSSEYLAYFSLCQRFSSYDTFSDGMQLAAHKNDTNWVRAVRAF